MENPIDLSELECDVMQVVWAGAPITADTVREQLPRKLKESTVRTVLRRLEAKGFVRHRVDGRTYVFEPIAPRRNVAAGAVCRIVDWLCDGSIEEVLVGLLDTDKLDADRLRELAERITKAEKQEA
jgi:BlaI family transcriptional regulator, penicillinase repressor